MLLLRWSRGAACGCGGVREGGRHSLACGGVLEIVCPSWGVSSPGGASCAGHALYLLGSELLER